MTPPSTPAPNQPADDASAMTPRGRRVGRNVSLLAGGQVVTWSVTLAWTLVVPRLLGPARMGVLLAAWSAAAILGVVIVVATKPFLVRRMVSYPAETRGLIGTAVMLRISLIPVFGAVAVIYCRLAHYGGGKSLILYLATGATLLTLLAEPMQAAFQSIERMEYLAYSDVFTKTSMSLIGIALAVWGFGAVGITACWLVTAGIALLLNAWWARAHVGFELRTNWRRMRAVAGESLPYYANGLFFIIYLWIDMVMLGFMVPPAVVGWYGVPTRIFQTLMFVPVILSTAWLPRLVRAFEESRDRLNTAATTPVQLALIASLPICVGTAMIAGPMIRLMYGADYANATTVMVVLAFCLPPMYLNVMFAQVMVAQRRPMVWTWIMVGATVVNPLLNVVLIRYFQSHYHNGAIGAAVSLLLTEVLITGVGLVLVGYRLLGQRAPLSRIARAVVASVGMWAVMYTSRPLGAAPAAALGGATFLGLATVLGVASTEDLEPFRAFGRRLLRVVSRGRLLPQGEPSAAPR